jgi:hypothetical protein
MRVEGRWMPEILRGRLARDQREHERKRERGRRVIGAVLLGSLVIVPSAGCLLGALAGGLGASIEGFDAIVVGGVSGAVAGTVVGLGVCLVEVLTLGLGGAITRAMTRGAYERVQQQFTFVIALIDALVDDLHPAHKVAVLLDTEGLTPRKRIWTGRSMHGNPKRRYADRWLDLRFVTVDGTAFRLRMQADVKTKYANDLILKVKRRMDLRVRPPERGRRDFDPHEVEDAARDAIALAFHDRPEKLRVRASSDGGVARVGVMQLDAPIFPDEVVSLAAAVLMAARSR